MGINELYRKLSTVILWLARFLEMVVALVLAVAIVIELLSPIWRIQGFLSSVGDTQLFQPFLAWSFSLVVGIEFLKMISRHDLSATIDVLLFSIARKMVIEHGSALENLFVVVAIAVLFVVRKYAFIPQKDN